MDSKTKEFLMSIIPLAVFNFIVVASLLYYFVLTKLGKAREDEELKTRGETPLLGMWIRQWWFWIINPIFRFFIRRRINPDYITVSTVIIAVGAAASFYHGHIALGGWLILLYGTVDLVDGRVARETGQVTRSGSFLDSVLDRYSELITYAALLMKERDNFMFYFVLLMIIGSILVSYTKARAESLGVTITRGIMQRPERIVYLGVCSALSPLLTFALSYYMENPPEILYMFAIILIAVFSNISAMQRLVYGYIALKKMNSGSAT